MSNRAMKCTKVQIMIAYRNEIRENGIIYSLDMIRLKLSFSFRNPVKIKNKNYNPFDSDSTEYVYTDRHSASEDFIKCIYSNYNLHYEYYQKISSYSYRHLFTFKDENEESIVIGIGWNDSGKTNMYSGFIEYNPNKVDTNCFTFTYLRDSLKACLKTVQLSRWDFALDIPVNRGAIGLYKDRRHYRLEWNSNEDKTEYLGTRNSHGYVKLYNKKIESNLTHDLTRCEITISGLPSYEEVNRILPFTTSFSDCSLADLPDTDKLIVKLLQEREDGIDLLKALGRKKQEKLKPYLFGANKTLSVSESVYLSMARVVQTHTLQFVYFEQLVTYV